MPSRRVSCQQQSPYSVESPPSDSNSLCTMPEHIFGSVDAKGNQCLQEAETMPNKMVVSQQPSCSTSVESPPSDSNSSSRYHRNLAEKQRRDKLNGYITELATLVPMVSMTTRRLDKTSILRLSAAYLRIYQSKLNPSKCKKFSWGPDILNSDHLNELLQASGGFLLIASFPDKVIYAPQNAESLLGQQTERFLGKLIYVSPNVEKILGQQNIDMIGQSLFHFIHPDEAKYFLERLRSTAQSPNYRSSQSRRSVFCARMKERSMPRSEAVNYQLMHFSCSLDTDGDDRSFERKPSSMKKEKSSGIERKTDILITAFVKPVTTNPLNELSITEAFQEEYVTRHGIDGKILFADHRISTITGHLPHEVHGMSAYEYIFEKDIPIAILAHKRMFSSIDGTGMIVYRLRTATNGAVYLKSTGHLQFDKSSTKVHQFICINKLLSEEDGEKELQRFIEHYTPHINSTGSPPMLHPILPALNSVKVSSLLDTPFSPEVRSPPSSRAVLTPCNGASSQHDLHSPSSFLRSDSSPTVSPPSSDSTLPAGLTGPIPNGESSLSPCTFSSGAAHSPNRMFDPEPSNYAQQCESDEHLLQDEGSFSNRYFAIAAAFCSKMSSEQGMGASHSADVTENDANHQHLLSKRKRSLENVYNSSFSMDNCSEDLAKSKYTKLSTDIGNAGYIQTLGITVKNSQSGLEDNLVRKVLHSGYQTQISDIPSSDFVDIPQKDICRTQLQGYARSLEDNVICHFDPSVNEKLSTENPPEGVADTSQNSRKVNMGWSLNGDNASPFRGRINHVRASHFNGSPVSNVEYRNGVTAVVRSLSLQDDSEEWFKDSFNGLNHLDGKY